MKDLTGLLSIYETNLEGFQVVPVEAIASVDQKFPGIPDYLVED